LSDRVLVTGATGFIGHHVVETLLERGDRVACLVRPTSDTSGLPVDSLELRLGDVTDSASLDAAVEDIDVVYHLAGALEARSLAELNLVNEAGPRNMAASCARLEKPPVLVLLSSLEAAGPDIPGQLRTEQDRSAPVSNYGRSKLAGELVIGEFSADVPITIVRASGVFGERDRETLEVVNAFRVGGLDIYTVPLAHTTVLNLIHASDLADLLVLAAEKGERIQPDEGTYQPAGQGLYYAADKERLTLAEVVGNVAKFIAHNRVRIINLPVGFAWIMAGTSEACARIRGQSPGIVNLDKVRSFAAGSFTCSADKSARQLGFSPARSLDERLSQTLAWYQEHGWL